MTYDFRVHDYYMMFKPFKYWGDYTENEHINWFNGLPPNPFEHVSLPKITINTGNSIQMTPEIESMLEQMFYNQPVSPIKSPVSPFAKMMSPKFLEKGFFRPKRRKSSSSSG